MSSVTSDPTAHADGIILAKQSRPYQSKPRHLFADHETIAQHLWKRLIYMAIYVKWLAAYIAPGAVPSAA
jgi:hypothetical protein